LSVIMLDIDHFKAINDDFGHLIGDKVLADLGRLLMQATRNVDTVCRWGGEEFVVICHETPLGQAEQLAERLLQRAREHGFASQRPLTLSAGVAHVQAGDVPDTLVARADAALYQAKNSGRNRVCVAAPVQADTPPS
jgi:diguanylate cyclase (GGDEF)-like protein